VKHLRHGARWVSARFGEMTFLRSRTNAFASFLEKKVDISNALTMDVKV
jgi:hypothetical protein